MVLQTRFKSAIIGTGNNRGKVWKKEVGGFRWIVEAVRRLALEESELCFDIQLVFRLPTYHARWNKRLPTRTYRFWVYCNLVRDKMAIHCWICRMHRKSRVKGNFCPAFLAVFALALDYDALAPLKLDITWHCSSHFLVGVCKRIPHFNLHFSQKKALLEGTFLFWSSCFTFPGPCGN
jgi:hypothetical protein